SSGATFVAQGFSRDITGLTKMLADAINHDGFSFVNAFSPCVTYNQVNSYNWIKENLISMVKLADFDTTDTKKATQQVLEYNSLLKGIVYQDTETPSYESQIEEIEGTALAKKDIHLDEQQFKDLTKQFV